MLKLPLTYHVRFCRIITGPWKRLVYDTEGRIKCASYSLCLQERLQDSLRRQDSWLENSDR